MQMNTSQKATLSHHLSARTYQVMEILQMPVAALQERIDRELIENPMLVDLRDASEGEVASTPERDSEPEIDFDVDFADDWNERFQETHRPSRAAMSEETDRRYDAMQNMSSRPESLLDDLAHQLGFLDCPPELRATAEYIIYNLDDSGFLRTSLADIVRDLAGAATLEQAEQALQLVQRLDPPGVGARDLRECLLLQLTPEMPYSDVLRVLIADHLEEIEQNRLPAIARKTGFSIETIEEAIDQLRHLNLRPGAREDPMNAQHVVPDLIVEPNDSGGYDVRLVDDYTPQLAVSRQYRHLMRGNRTDRETRQFLKRKIESARWLIEAIQQRRNTILLVAQAIIDHQRNFLDIGPEAIEPLKMQQIADRVGRHVTTVSRAVDDKWVQTPRGIFPLKGFFGGGAKSADGEEVAWETIKQKLIEIIAGEDKRNPLSDDEIAEKLKEACGIPVARRTVTKYRKGHNIPSSRGRKKH